MTWLLEEKIAQFFMFDMLFEVNISFFRIKVNGLIPILPLSWKHFGACVVGLDEQFYPP